MCDENIAFENAAARACDVNPDETSTFSRHARSKVMLIIGNAAIVDFCSKPNQDFLVRAEHFFGVHFIAFEFLVSATIFNEFPLSAFFSL